MAVGELITRTEEGWGAKDGGGGNYGGGARDGEEGK